ncbi:MAG: PDDEXK nuclease domain-containing protein [Candidatus Adiutrix sp.]|nr:PDDEXK nuclease domain-containing protein [Candidatus Adiutrix sp.]
MELINLAQMLLADVTEIIEQGRQTIAAHALRTSAFTFWQVGQRINQDVLNNERAEYGKQIISTLATQLMGIYGRTYELRNLRRMMQFAEQFPDFEIVSPLATQLSWSHFVEILPLKTQEAKLYYLEEAARGVLGKRGLHELINRKAYERRDIANAQLNRAGKVPFNVFKDPYLLDSLGLNDDYAEADLESAILGEIEKFILEFGKGFAFVERQKRMIIDGVDFHLDLLLFNRYLRRLVAVELKLSKFHAEYNGQMKLYLKWLNRYERQEWEEEPIGIILCTEGNREQIELLELDKDGIMVAEYWTALPPKAEFERRIHTILTETRERIARRKLMLMDGETDEN